MLQCGFVSSVFIEVFRSGNSLLGAPPFAKSRGDRASIETQSFRPLGSTKSFAIVGYKKIIRLVSTITFWSNPSTVFGSVVATVINSIDLMFWGRSLAHVFDEIPKIISPMIAHFNSLLAITFKCYVPWVIAAGYHRIPSFIKRVFGEIHRASLLIVNEFLKHLNAQILCKEY